MRFLSFTNDEIVAGLIGITTGIAVAFVVYQFIRWNPWPRPFRVRFAAKHAAAGVTAALLWHTFSAVVSTVVAGAPLLLYMRSRLEERIFIGFILYLIVAGIAYAIEASGRAARAEALSASTQLAALRAQLHPHFLFNALHTVVQLIPAEPKRAVEAAELVADLLRTTIEEKRDEVTLADEWSFVSRYVAVERIRFGDRLIVRETIPVALFDERVPAFAVQTLVENAVRHGAAPSIAPTEIAIAASANVSELTVSVFNSGDGTKHSAASGTGTGLARLRERLAVLYGGAARLECGPDDNGGFKAVLIIPRGKGRSA